jgi:hypothetical protein
LIASMIELGSAEDKAREDERGLPEYPVCRCSKGAVPNTIEGVDRLSGRKMKHLESRLISEDCRTEILRCCSADQSTAQEVRRTSRFAASGRS